MSNKIRIVLAQLKCELLNKEINLKRTLETIKEAKEKNGDYVLFPELFLTGYVMNQKVRSLGEPIEGESIKKIAHCAKEHGIGVIYGFPELEGEKLYNSAAFINKNGEIVGVYRKTHLFHHERTFFEPGNQCPIFSIPQGNIGFLITYDMEFPEMPRILATKGANVIFVLCANMVPYQNYQNTFLQSRAIENHVFTVATNKVGLDSDNIFFGESQVVNPEGKILYKGGNNEEVSVIEINLDDIKRSKGVLDYINNRRVNLYQSEGW